MRLRGYVLADNCSKAGDEGLRGVMNQVVTDVTGERDLGRASTLPPTSLHLSSYISLIEKEEAPATGDATGASGSLRGNL